MGPHEFNVLLGCFGVAAAILLVGGSVMLRAQQNRHRFELAKKSLETGHPLPPAEPLWKGLQRQAQSILAVGLGLLIVGGAAWFSGSRVERPANAEPPSPATQQVMVNPFGRPPPPPRPSPEVEEWQRAQVRVAIGQSAMGCGLILTLLGLSRRSAAKSERQSQVTTGTTVS